MRLTLCGTVLAALAVGLLNSEASSEGAGDSSVTAADSAHVSGRGTDAVEVVGHGNRDNEILLLDLGQTVGTGDVVGNLQRDSEAGSVAGLVKVALIGTGAVGVDLAVGEEPVDRFAASAAAPRRAAPTAPATGSAAAQIVAPTLQRYLTSPDL